MTSSHVAQPGAGAAQVDSSGLSTGGHEPANLGDILLMALERRMGELLDHFELRHEDLNLDLGPLGPLLPYE